MKQKLCEQARLDGLLWHQRPPGPERQDRPEKQERRVEPEEQVRPNDPSWAINGKTNGKRKRQVWNDPIGSKIDNPWPNRSWNVKTKTSEIWPTSQPLKWKRSRNTPAPSSWSARLKQSVGLTHGLTDMTGENVACVPWQAEVVDAIVDTTALSRELHNSDNGIGIEGKKPEKEEEMALVFLSFFSLCAANLNDVHSLSATSHHFSHGSHCNSLLHCTPYLNNLCLTNEAPYP